MKIRFPIPLDGPHYHRFTTIFYFGILCFWDLIQIFWIQARILFSMQIYGHRSKKSKIYYCKLILILFTAKRNFSLPWFILYLPWVNLRLDIYSTRTQGVPMHRSLSIPILHFSARSRTLSLYLYGESLLLVC